MSALRRFAERFIRFSGMGNAEDHEAETEAEEDGTISISPFRRSRLESSAIESEADVRRSVEFLEVSEYPDQSYFSDEDGENSPTRSPNRKRIAISGRSGSRRRNDNDETSAENNSRSFTRANSLQRRSMYNQQKNHQHSKKSNGEQSGEHGFKFRRNKVDQLLNSNKGKMYRKEDRGMISGSLSFIYENEILTDLTIIVGDDSKEEIKAHKAILSSQSPYFRALIESAAEEESLDDSIIIVDHFSVDIVEKIVSFLYSGKIQLSDSNVIDIFLASDHFKILELKRKCEEHVSSFISCDSLCILLQAARAHNAKDLERKCITFFQNNAENVLASDSFLEISEDLLIDLLCKDFFISNELVVFDFVVRWGKSKSRALAIKAIPNSPVKSPMKPLRNLNSSLPTLRELLKNVMPFVRLISIPIGPLESKVSQADVVEEDLLLEVLYRKMQNGLTYSAGESYDTPDALDQQGRPVKFYLKPRRGNWKRLIDFDSESQYGEYLKSVLRPGMLLRAINSYEQIREGDVGEFLQYNSGVPPCQVRWQIYGNTYWLFWKDIELVS